MKFILFAFLFLMPAMAHADTQTQQAEGFISDLGNQAIGVLETNANNDDVLRSEFSRILNKNFDMDTIARFSLGRYWGVATDSEKKEYTTLFKDMVVDVYTERFSDYSNQKLVVNGAKPAGRNDVIVNSSVVGKGNPIRVDWRVRDGRVIDVIVEGVSMSVTQRNDFASIIQRNGGNVSGLINHLKK